MVDTVKNNKRVEDPQYMLKGKVIDNTIRISRRTSKLTYETITVPIPDDEFDGDEVKCTVNVMPDCNYELIGRIKQSNKSDSELIVIHRQVNPICAEVLLVPIPDDDVTEVNVPVKVKIFDEQEGFVGRNRRQQPPFDRNV